MVQFECSRAMPKEYMKTKWISVVNCCSRWHLSILKPNGSNKFKNNDLNNKIVAHNEKFRNFDEFMFNFIFLGKNATYFFQIFSQTALTQQRWLKLYLLFVFFWNVLYALIVLCWVELAWRLPVDDSSSNWGLL